MSPVGAPVRHVATLAVLVSLLVVAGLLTSAPTWSQVRLGSVAADPVVDPTLPTVPTVPTGATATGTPTATARNAIVFLVDDMSDFPCSQVSSYLPRSAHWLRQRGTCYENAATATPVCCPARAQVQTGQLAHNNRVRTQGDAIRLDPRATVQADLGLAGLRTYGIGKNLNGIKASAYYGPHRIGNGFQDFDFWNSYRHRAGEFPLYADDGTPYIPTTGLNSAETNGAFMDAALDDYLASGDRFFVYSAFFAPHKQSVRTDDDSLPQPSAANALAPVPPFRYAPETYARDKLGMFAKPRRSRSYYQRLWNARIRSLYDVDDQMARTFQRLEDAGVLDETAVIFTSDNGYTDRGQYNWDGKAIPYPAATDVPMLAWYPGRGPRVVTTGAQLIDVAPTLYDVLGVAPRHRLDGHSLLGGHQRRTFYGEFKQENSHMVDLESGKPTGHVRTWRVVKRGTWSYVEWYRRNGRVLRRELYADRAMVRNVLWRPGAARRHAEVVRQLSRELRRLSRCAGTSEAGARNPCT